MQFCESRIKPSAKRPGGLPWCLSFNQIVGADLFDFDEFGWQQHFLNVICWGTGYQMCETVKDKQSNTEREAFARCWTKHYGAPELLVTDQGPEFLGGAFTGYLAEQGCVHHTIDSQSPWQQGRTERAGGSLQENLRDVVRDCGIVL